MQYSSKVRSIDLKVMSAICLDEMKQDYEQKLANVNKQLKNQLNTQKEEFEKEIVILCIII